eukprot:scaffold249199_cov27-Tisochrysis_lutea.AAC.1
MSGSRQMPQSPRSCCTSPALSTHACTSISSQSAASGSSSSYSYSESPSTLGSVLARALTVGEGARLARRGVGRTARRLLPFSASALAERVSSPARRATRRRLEPIATLALLSPVWLRASNPPARLSLRHLKLPSPPPPLPHFLRSAARRKCGYAGDKIKRREA